MADNLTNIKDHLSDFVSKETELAKAEIVPSAKKAGLGSAMVIIALVFVLHAVWMLIIALAGLFSWLVSLAGLSTPISLVLGFLIAMLVSLILAGIFGFIGYRYFKKVKAPTATIAEFKATVNAVTESIAGKNHGAMPQSTPGLTVVDEEGSRVGTMPRRGATAVDESGRPA